MVSHTHRRQYLPALSPQKAGTGHNKDKSELGKDMNRIAKHRQRSSAPFASREMPIQTTEAPGMVGYTVILALESRGRGITASLMVALSTN